MMQKNPSPSLSLSLNSVLDTSTLPILLLISSSHSLTPSGGTSNASWTQWPLRGTRRFAASRRQPRSRGCSGRAPTRLLRAEIMMRTRHFCASDFWSIVQRVSSKGFARKFGACSRVTLVALHPRSRTAWDLESASGRVRKPGRCSGCQSLSQSFCKSFQRILETLAPPIQKQSR
jgi:hypothetical protein